MSFKQSVLIPLKDYNKLTSANSKCNDKRDILMNDTLPSEIKLRLREQDKILGVKKPSKPIKVSLDKKSLTTLRDNYKKIKKHEKKKDNVGAVQSDNDNISVGIEDKDVVTDKKNKEVGIEDKDAVTDKKNEEVGIEDKDAIIDKTNEEDDVILGNNELDMLYQLQPNSDDEEFLDAITDQESNDEKSKLLTKTNKPKKVIFDTRSSKSMLTRSQQAGLSELGKKSLDNNSKIPEQKEKRKRPIQSGKGFSWIVY